ncbi:MAG: J domain-containing protein [Acidobacteriota bacterium]|nr:J domain-containing protein [Acidobacteriota bacterium]
MSDEATRREEPEVPLISFAKVGKNRYIWAAATVTDFCEGNVEHFGYVDSAEKAEDECARVAHLLDPSRPFRRLEKKDYDKKFWARTWHPRVVSAKQKEKHSASPGSAREEFVYQTWHGSADDWWPTPSRSDPHLILKKTAKRIVIHAEPYRGPESTWGYEQVFHLDRATLESTGTVRHNGHEYTLEPIKQDFAESHNQWLHEKAATLGVTWPCSLRELTSAFREKAKEVHPDKGGTDVEFIELRKAFDQLVKIAQ